MVIGTICNMAIVLPFPDNRETSREDCSWATDKLHLVAEIVRQQLDRSSNHWATRTASRACFHAYPIRVRSGYNVALPYMVLVPMAKCDIPSFTLLLERIQWSYVLY